MKRNRSDENGQSTIEMALVLVLLFTFTIFFVRLSLIFGFANYAQYASFMAARCYLSASSDIASQKEGANAMILATMKRNDGSDRYPWIAKGFGGGNIAGMEIRDSLADPNTVWMTGVRYTFKSKLFLLPLGGISSKTDAMNQLTLTSESWLGRDTSYIDCQTNMGAMKGLFDNGC